MASQMAASKVRIGRMAPLYHSGPTRQSEKAMTKGARTGGQIKDCRSAPPRLI
jgi:hypothetical protein